MACLNTMFGYDDFSSLSYIKCTKCSLNLVYMFLFVWPININVLVRNGKGYKQILQTLQTACEVTKKSIETIFGYTHRVVAINWLKRDLSSGVGLDRK